MAETAYEPMEIWKRITTQRGEKFVVYNYNRKQTRECVVGSGIGNGSCFARDEPGKESIFPTHIKSFYIYWMYLYAAL